MEPTTKRMLLKAKDYDNMLVVAMEKQEAKEESDDLQYTLNSIQYKQAGLNQAEVAYNVLKQVIEKIEDSEEYEVAMIALESLNEIANMYEGLCE